MRTPLKLIVFVGALLLPSLALAAVLNGGACRRDSDCVSGKCSSNVCVGRAAGQACTIDDQCVNLCRGGVCCGTRDPGGACTAGTQCDFCACSGTTSTSVCCQDGESACNGVCCPNGQCCNNKCVTKNATLCGTSCANAAACPTTANGSAACSGGVCSLACNAGYVMCGGSCIVPNTNANCGACGNSCDSLLGLGCVQVSGQYVCACNSTNCSGATKCCGKTDPSQLANNTCYNVVPSDALCPMCVVSNGCGSTGGCKVEAESVPASYSNALPLTRTLSGTTEVVMRGAGTFKVPTSVQNAGTFTVNLRLKAERYVCGSGAPAVGSAGSGSPHVIITWVDSAGTQTLYNGNIDSNAYSTFTYTVTAAAGSDEVVINFDNDCWSSTTTGGGAALASQDGYDRNVVVDWVQVSPSSAALAGYQVCGTACVDTTSDVNHCGDCTTVCAAGSTCLDGTCVSPVCLTAIPGLIDKPMTLSGTNTAACRLSGTSVAQSAADNQGGEDQSFFVAETGTPSMLIVVDAGVSMRNLPQDPACQVSTETCTDASVANIIDSFFTKGTSGQAPYDSDYTNMFSKDKLYLAQNDNLFVGADCASFTTTDTAWNDDAAGRTTACTKAGATNATQCSNCLRDKGYYVLPNGKRVWSGQFLNVYPPKCLTARKMLKSPTLVGQTKIRYSVAYTAATTGTGSTAEPGINFILSGFQPNQCTSGALKKDDTKPAPQYFNNIQNQLRWNVSGSKPLAEALFSAGQFMLDSSSQYTTWFGSSWTKNTYDTATWSSTGANSQVSVCSTCQKSAVVFITDGKPCKDNRLPTSSSPLSTYTPLASDGVSCAANTPGCKDTCDGSVNWAASVAAMLNNEDLRTEHAGKQTMQTYMIGFGVDSQGLKDVANRGGGDFYSVFTGDQLDEAIKAVLTNVSNRSLGVSAPALSTLQTKTGSSALVPRFVPSRDAAWEGELAKYTIFSEFANGCVADGKRQDAGVATTTDDTRCVCKNSVCDGIYTLDKNGDFAGVDPSDGRMVLVDPRVLDSDGNPTVKAGPVPAVPIWSAGTLLNGTAPSDRKIYTVVDSNSDGKIDNSDDMLQLALDDTTIGKLLPYLNLGSTGLYGAPPKDNRRVCDLLVRQLRKGGVVINNMTETLCAKTVVAFLMGLDTFNASGAQTSTQQVSFASNISTLPSRPFKLGDIFHSSPIRVDPPVSKFPLCDRGFHNQCLRSLYSSDVPLDTSGSNGGPLCGIDSDTASSLDQYERYVYAKTHIQKRPSVVLVGANDGMLHAFQLTCYTGKNSTTGQAIYNDATGLNDTGLTDCPTGVKNGTELWAFIPPDLLPKLAQTVVGNRHPFLVDGTPMVRDVWVDGVGATAKDGKKACDEYRTVAIIGERRGGNRYTALDITDPTAPRFRWMFPQIGSPDENRMGETWTDFLPAPPPIGPVKLSSTSSAGFEERWVAMLSGGFDPRRIRGNSLYMLDVWNGTKLWEAKPKASTSTAGMTHPIAAVPAMVAWGNSYTSTNFDFNKGYFDTAVVGDIGGQVWVARFNAPGTFAANPYTTNDVDIATNWNIARGFQEAKADGDNILNRSPFFSVASAIRLPNSAVLRAFIGTGDRLNLRQTDIGQCTLDDPLSCARQGSAVSVSTDSAGYTIGNDTLSVSWGIDSSGTYTRTETTSAYSASSPPACASLTAPVGVDLGVTISACSRTGCGTLGTGTKDVRYECYFRNSQFLCDGDVADRAAVPTAMTAATLGTLAPSPKFRNRYVAFNVFRADTDLFTSGSTASTYDSGRLTESDLKLLDPYDAPSALATESDKGWYFYLPALDEKVATNNTIFNGCLLFSTLQPSIPCSTNADCPSGVSCVAGGCYVPKADCGSGSSQVNAFLYQASAVTGGKECALTGSPNRRTATKVVVPPPPPQEVVQINPYGQYKTAVGAPPGTTPPPAPTTTYSLMRYLYTNEIPRNVHDCRHTSSGTCR